jgi:hypothetical protein
MRAIARAAPRSPRSLVCRSRRDSARGRAYRGDDMSFRSIRRRAARRFATPCSWRRCARAAAGPALFPCATPAPFRSRWSPAPNANSEPTALAWSSISICSRHLPRTGRRPSPIWRSRRNDGWRRRYRRPLSSALSHSRSGSRTPIAWRWSRVSSTYSALSPDWPVPARTWASIASRSRRPAYCS